MWGRNADLFFDHILNQVYQLEECDSFFLMGDLNARIGNKKDFIPEVDDVGARVALDTKGNKHGDFFVYQSQD